MVEDCATPKSDYLPLFDFHRRESCRNYELEECYCINMPVLYWTDACNNVSGYYFPTDAGAAHLSQSW